MTLTRRVMVGPVAIGGGAPLALIAGPCAIESEVLCLQVASALKEIGGRLGLPVIFKASYDKANRSSVDSFRGPGLIDGLRALSRVKADTGLPVLTDIHAADQAAPVAAVADALQVPAFLCRQTDILVAAGRAGRPVNLKKGQFVAPEDMASAARKVESSGNGQVFLTERGASFGYHNLVVDMRSLAIMRGLGYPVVFDATHSVQLPSAGDGCSGGDRGFVPVLARAAVAAGVDAVFMEVHPDPDRALCDGPNSWPLDQLEPLLRSLLAIHAAAGKTFSS